MSIETSLIVCFCYLCLSFTAGAGLGTRKTEDNEDNGNKIFDNTKKVFFAVSAVAALIIAALMPLFDYSYISRAILLFILSYVAYAYGNRLVQAKKYLKNKIGKK